MKKIFLLLMLSCLMVNVVLAEDPPPTEIEYKLLAPIPGVGTTDDPTKANPSTYIAGFFQLMIAISGVLAVVMLIYGGVKYASTDAFSSKSEGKEIITNALWGLLLAIGSYLILYTISPKLVNFNLSLIPVDLPPPAPPSSGGGGSPPGGGRGVLPGYELTPEQLEEDGRIRRELASNVPPVTVNRTVPCIDGGTSGCTNVVGLPRNAIDSILSLATTCRCSVMITGGTEGGHVEHGPGRPVVDLRPTSGPTGLNTYLARTNPQAANPRSGTTVTIGTVTYTFEPRGGRSSEDHWHVVIR